MKKDKPQPDATEKVQAPKAPPEDRAAEAAPAQEAEEHSIDEWREALETAVQQRDEGLEKLKKAEGERDGYLDSLKRSQADFINFKRRNQTVRAEAYDDGSRDAISAILPTIDNLERAIDAGRAAGESEALLSGVTMTLTQLMGALGKLGLSEIPAEGEKFDPEMHNAVMREEGPEPGMVLQVLQKGYRVKDKIIRYAMVKVSAE